MINKAFLAILLSGMTLLVLPSISSAHAHLVKSDPVVGAVLTTPPKMVQIWFSSMVEGDFSSIQVEDATGKRVDGNDTKLGDKGAHLLIVSLPGDIKAGRYHVLWKALATDGHKTTGTFPFTVQ